MTRSRLFAFLCTILTLSASPALAIGAKLYREPDCGCCLSYADYLRSHGYDVAVVEADTASLKAGYGVPQALAGCHTTIIAGYVIEGHVPVEAIAKLVAEQPLIDGISLPGMPQGSPGMTGIQNEPFMVYTIEPQPRLYVVQ